MSDDDPFRRLAEGFFNATRPAEHGVEVRALTKLLRQVAGAAGGSLVTALDAAEALTILELLSWETVVDPTDAFPYRISKRFQGYHPHPTLGGLQAKLSILLEAVATPVAKGSALRPAGQGVLEPLVLLPDGPRRGDPPLQDGEP